MRSVICSFTLLVAVALPVAQEQDATAVLKEVRQALGGDAALDAIQTFSVNGHTTMRTPMGPRQTSFEWFAAFPDRFLEIRRDTGSGSNLTGFSITYYMGIRGTEPIRKVDSTIPMPPDPFQSSSPDANRRRWLSLNQRHLARVMVVLFGAAPSVYPLTFTHAGREQADGRTFDVLDGVAADGFSLRVHVDANTHLPAALTWKDERPLTMTTTSTVTTRGDQVVGRSPETVTTPPSPPGPTVDYQWLVSDYKVDKGINWPRKIEFVVPGGFSEEIRIRGIKVNPKIDARRFDIK